MPELPEVETVRLGLAPVLEGARFRNVELRRGDLRRPLPARFATRIAGARVLALRRRGKYLVGDLSTGESLIMHLGMSGRFHFAGGGRSPNDAYYVKPPDPSHDHVVFDVKGPAGAARIFYNDPRRFGLMDLAPTAELAACEHFRGMGPEPLDREFSAAAFNQRLEGRAAPVKAILLDQRAVAGVGNIYACEALFRASVSPKRKGKSVAGSRGERLHAALVAVLKEAIEAGGSTLTSFAASDGARGRFQHGFKVYDREGAPCPACGGRIRRVVQAGRSTFYCAICQR